MRNATIDPWAIRICRALRLSGGFRALTALETASMPVSEEPPLAKDRSSMYTMPKLSSPSVLCPTGNVAPG
ncbi:MAG TPA: hypothetical protein VH478_03960 [Trebonia sp.]|nr:hypothetical protein [Trebonia sp.]